MRLYDQRNLLKKAFNRGFACCFRGVIDDRSDRKHGGKHGIGAGVESKHIISKMEAEEERLDLG